MKLRLAILTLIPLLGMAFLPEQIPHTNMNGRMNSMDQKGAFIFLFTLLALVFTIAPFLVSRLFEGSENQPNMALIGRLLRHYSLAFSIWFALLFGLIIYRFHDGPFSVIGGWIVSAVLFIPLVPFTLHWVIRNEKNS